MGGLAGHLSHLYDIPNISFGKIKEILSLASNGKLNVEEKIDGWNNYFSFKDGETVIARNKNDAKNGGLNLEGISKREFAGGEQAKQTYINATKSFQKAIQSLPERTQKILFKNGQIWYNCELLGPSSSNIINYDKNIIKIHNKNHIEYDPNTGELIPYNNEKNSMMLDNIVDKIEQQESGENFQLRKKAFSKLNAMNNDKDLKIAKIKLDKILSLENLTDKNTIEDYLRSKLKKYVQQQLPEVNEEIQNNIIENLLGNEKINIGYSKELKQKISQIKKQEKVLYKEAIFPIEEIIHDFSVELLKTFESAFVLDNKKESQRLKQELSKAIKIIQSSGNEEANKILSQQLKKIKNIDNIISSEGIVFQYGDNLIKFTGNFAPLNQIINLVRFGRGSKIPPMEKLEESGKGKIVAIVPGGFKPPHAGHFLIAKHFADMPEIDIVRVLISPKERVGHSGDNRITVTADMSLAIWNIYASHEPKIKPEISPEASPVKAVYDSFEELNPGDTAVLGLGEKEKKKGDTRFARSQEYADKVNPGVKIQIMEIPPQAGGISGGAMRELVALEDKEKIFRNLPNELSFEEKEKIWNILTQQNQIQELQEEKKSNISFQSISEEELKEVSVKDLKAKYPEYSSEIEAFGKNLDNKYVFPALRFFVASSTGESDSESIEKIIKKLKSYDHSLKTGKIEKGIENNLLDKQWNDINWVVKHNSVEAFADRVDTIQTEYESSEDIKAKAEKEIEKIYEDENWLVLWVKSHYSSCYYGSGTDWCISKYDQAFWNNYNKDNHIFFVFNKALEDDKQNPKRKTAILFPRIYRDDREGAYRNIKWVEKKFNHMWSCFDLNDKQFVGKCPNVPKEIISALSEKIYGKDLTQTAEPFEKSLEETSSMSSGAIEGAMTKPPFANFDKKENEEEKIKSLPKQLEEEEDYQDIIKRLHPKWKRKLIGKGGQNTGIAGSPFDKKPSFKRSLSSPPIGENYMIDRHKLIEELKLRQYIKQLIPERISKKKEKTLFQENLLRKYIRKLILEASAEDSDVPHNSTGINVLEDLLKKIIPVIEEDYKSLTTDTEQRKSFREHLLNAIQNTLIPARIKKEIGDEESQPPIGEGEIDVKIGEKENEENKEDTTPNIGPEGFIDISKKKPKQSKFTTLPGEDLTGRNMAMRTYDKVEKQISEAYNLLSNEEDENIFYDYLLTNIKLYCDKWEDELKGSIEEPQTPSYEEESESISSESPLNTEV